MHRDPSELEPEALAECPASCPTETLVFGVVGGIAAGKSAVARRLAGPEGRVIDADAIARQVLESEEVVGELVQAYGKQVLDPAGRPDRALLARRVFSSPQERARLEGWIHPRVRARIWADLEEARAQGVPRVVLDVPLLLEHSAQHGLLTECDHLIFIEVSDEERDRRAVSHRGWSEGEVFRREAAQLELAEKKQRADAVVQNEGSLADLDRAVAELLSSLGI